MKLVTKFEVVAFERVRNQGENAVRVTGWLHGPETKDGDALEMVTVSLIIHPKDGQPPFALDDKLTVTVELP